MMKVMVYATALAMMATVAGCASLSKAECQVADWLQIGERDGYQGYDWGRIADHAKACARVGVVPDQKTWEQGRQKGLKTYCTMPNAYRRGLSGNYLNDVCPVEIQEDLNIANRYGHNIYKLRNMVDSGKRDLKKLQDQLKKLQEGDNLEFKSEKEARAYMLELPEKIRKLENDISHYESEENRVKAIGDRRFLVY